MKLKKQIEEGIYFILSVVILTAIIDYTLFGWIA